MRDVKRLGFYPWVGRIPWVRTWHPTPVLLPGKSHGPEEPGGLMTHRIPKSQTWLKRLSTHAPQKMLEWAKYSFQFLGLSLARCLNLEVEVNWPRGVAVLQSEVEQSKLEPMHSDSNAHICHHPARVPQGGEIILQMSQDWCLSDPSLSTSKTMLLTTSEGVAIE